VSRHSSSSRWEANVALGNGEYNWFMWLLNRAVVESALKETADSNSILKIP
jgi:hypothetical protein